MRKYSFSEKWDMSAKIYVSADEKRNKKQENLSFSFFSNFMNNYGSPQKGIESAESFINIGP